MLRPWLELARISNLPTVWTNVVAAWVLGGGDRGWEDFRLGWLLLAGSLLYTGGMILNDAADVKFDRAHRKERPIPSGRVSAGLAWTVGVAMMLVGAWCALRGYANLWIILALLVAILFYDLYHKPWPGAVWVMGACRVLLFLMAGSALSVDLLTATTGGLVEPSVIFAWPALQALPPGVLLASLALGGYIVGLTMVARLEGKGGAPSRMAVFSARALVFAPGIVAVALLFPSGSLRPVAILGDLRPLAPLIVVFIFAATMAYALSVMRQGGPAIGRAVGILLASIPIVDALAVSRVSLPLALGFVALAPVLRFWQRWVAAT